MSDLESIAALESRIARLEAQTQIHEDIESIRRLKLRYAQLCDANYDARALAELFTEDGVWDGFEVLRGRGAIQDFFVRLAERFSFSVHYVMAHQVDLDPSGHEATGTCYVLDAVTVDGRAYWIANIHSDQYQKIDGMWLISYYKQKRLFFTPFDEGWVKQRFVDWLPQDNDRSTSDDRL